MSLPKQVQAALEAAEAQTQELVNPESPPNAEAPPLAPTEPNGQPEPAPAEPVAPAPEPKPTPPVTEQWERRYKTLQGMYDAEVPRLHTQVKELKNQLDAAIQRLDEAAKRVKPEAKQTLVTDKDVEDFGGDLIDLVRRQATDVARSEMGEQFAKLESENAQLRQQLTGVSEQQGENARSVYLADLARRVPDWEAVNTDQGFLEWLMEVDRLSGKPRQFYLNEAFNAHDVAQTAELFNAYKELTAAPAPTPTTPLELERQVAPGTSKASGAAPNNQAAKIWAMADIDKFYGDVARGRFKGREAEQAQIEADIDSAVRESRLRQ